MGQGEAPEIILRKRRLRYHLMKNVKKKPHKKSDGSWDTSDLYKSGGNPFDIEWVKYYNPVEGRDQILFLYSDKETKSIIKYRILR